MILVSLGFTQHELASTTAELMALYGVTPEPWIVADYLAQAGFDINVTECEQNNDDKCMTAQDAADCDAAYVYSWSWRTLLHKLKDAKDKGIAIKRKSLLVVCLGVEDPVWPRGFIPPDCFDKVIVFQLDDAWPRSEWAKNAPKFDILDPDIRSKIANGPYMVNVDCRKLWGTVACPIDMHTRTENTSQVTDLCVWAARTFVATQVAHSA